MPTQDAAHSFELHLASAELEIVWTALRHLLASEDDPATIEEIKSLLARLPRPGSEEPAGA